MNEYKPLVQSKTFSEAVGSALSVGHYRLSTADAAPMSAAQTLAGGAAPPALAPAQIVRRVREARQDHHSRHVWLAMGEHWDVD